jgi:hypothetical protein
VRIVLIVIVVVYQLGQAPGCELRILLLPQRGNEAKHSRGLAHVGVANGR